MTAKKTPQHCEPLRDYLPRSNLCGMGSHLDRIINQAQASSKDKDKAKTAWLLGRIAVADNGTHVVTMVKAHTYDVLFSMLEGFSVDTNVLRQVARTVYYMVQVPGLKHDHAM